MGCSLRAYGQEEAACTIFAHANKETEWVTNPPAVWSVSTHQMKLKGRAGEKTLSRGYDVEYEYEDSNVGSMMAR